MKKHEEKAWLKSCIISLDELVQLSSLIQEGFPADFGFLVSAKYGNMDINHSSLQEFLARPDLPDVLENFCIRVWYPKKYFSNDIEKEIFFFLNNHSSSFTISGVDETWAAGKLIQISRFMRGKTDKFQWVKEIPRKNTFISIVVGFWLATLINLVPTMNWIYSCIFCISTSYFIVIYIYRSWMTFPVRTNKIILKKKKNLLWGMNKTELVAIVIALLGVIISLTQTLIQILVK